MNIFRSFHDRVAAAAGALAGDGVLPPGLDMSRVTVEPPRDPAHGDLSTNAAMVLAKPAGMKPRDLAAAIQSQLTGGDGITDVEIAGPGFINVRFADDVWRAEIAEIFAAGESYGDSEMGGGEPVNVEYVSVNPTGPLHVGHARGAVVGDALAALLSKAGFKVTREYWVNDAGAQIEILARSLHVRYREALGEKTGGVSEGLYPGEYLLPPARALAERDGDKWLGADESEWLKPFSDFAVAAMMDLIRDDLKTLGVEQDVFTSERGIVDDGKVDAALADLEGRGLMYTGVLEPPKGMTPEDWEPRPQTLFRATDFGDDIDRPVKKSDGSWTYFATDIGYHHDKHRRGFNRMINIWGADHGGYVKRLQAATRAVSGGEGRLTIKLCQMVNLLDGGKPVKMSKRAGKFVTLRDVVDAVGKDVVRFMMLTRRNDAHLDFDLARVTEQSKDNPVFYVQYAHARVASVLRHAAEIWGGDAVSDKALAGADMSYVKDRAELDIIRRLASWPRTVEAAAESEEPHRVALFLHDLAADFHALWTKGKDDAALRFILEDEPEKTLARLALIRCVQLVVASGLRVFGVTPVQEM
ncbi:MAG: arginine--tRNA ligase [Rhodospirillales bacterium]